jgi:hypothetical protein
LFSIVFKFFTKITVVVSSTNNPPWFKKTKYKTQISNYYHARLSQVFFFIVAFNRSEIFHKYFRCCVIDQQPTLLKKNKKS